MLGREILFQNDLQPVGQRLPQTKQADLCERDTDSIGAAAILHPRCDPPLQQHEIGCRGHQAADEQADLHKRGNRLEGWKECVHEWEGVALVWIESADTSWWMRRSTPVAGMSPASAAKLADDSAIWRRTAVGS